MIDCFVFWYCLQFSQQTCTVYSWPALSQLHSAICFSPSNSVQGYGERTVCTFPQISHTLLLGLHLHHTLLTVCESGPTCSAHSSRSTTMVRVRRAATRVRTICGVRWSPSLTWVFLLYSPPRPLYALCTCRYTLAEFAHYAASRTTTIDMT